MEYYQSPIEQVYRAVDSSKEGLTGDQAGERLSRYGPNELEVAEKEPAWKLFVAQFKEVFSVLLIAAGLLSLALGNVRDAVVIFAITVVNAVIGFVQEYRAEQILDRLKDMIESPAKVMRDGRLSEVGQSELVVGDIVKIEEGDKVPADLRLCGAFNLRTNEFALTGESLPQEKQTNTISGDRTLGDRDNMAYLGTTVATGTARGVVVRTGMDTEIGRIANLTQERKTTESPLEKELRVLASQLSVVVVVIGAILFMVAYIQGFALQTALILALGIAVAMVPQALPAQVSVALSQGSGRLAQKNAIVRRLSSMETLGSATVIATDKTGTITRNQMTVRSLWFDGRRYEVTGLGYEPEGGILDDDGTPLTKDQLGGLVHMLDAATLASNAEIHPPDDQHPDWYSIGDPTEAALITLSTKVGVRSPREDEEKPELKEFSFDSERKRMSSVRKIDDRFVLCAKGAPESILSVSTRWLRNGKVTKLTDEGRRQIRDTVADYSADAMRVLAIAYRCLDDELQDWTEKEAERDVIFLGLVAMIDPPKEGVRDAVAAAHRAHIRTFMLTGDHAITARAIADEIGLMDTGEAEPPSAGHGRETREAQRAARRARLREAAAYELSEALGLAGAALAPRRFDPLDDPVITGQELKEMSDGELERAMRKHENLIFARVSPEDKLRVVKSLKEQGKIVAVTGDGVNDAPALKNADIGVAMGEIGTDVAKEAADLVLLDDSYSTLVYAVRQGRIIYNNLKKTILASMTTNVAELGVVLFSLAGVALWGWPIAILAIQILSIDLLGENLPLTALTYDPGSAALMRARPRDPKEHIFDIYSAVEIAFLGMFMAGLAFLGYYWFMRVNGVVLTATHPLYARATTLTYTTVVFCQYINVLSRRFALYNISYQFWTNKVLLGTIVFSAGLVLAIIYVPFLSHFVQFAPLTLTDWGYVAFAMVVFLGAHEVIKYRRRRTRRALGAL